MTDSLESKAQQLQTKINKQIEKACDGKSPLQWNFIMEQTVEMFIGDTPWEYITHTRMGSVPQIVLTEYRATNYREPAREQRNEDF